MLWDGFGITIMKMMKEISVRVEMDIVRTGSPMRSDQHPKGTWAQPTGWPLSHQVHQKEDLKKRGIQDDIQAKGTKLPQNLDYIHCEKTM